MERTSGGGFDLARSGQVFHNHEVLLALILALQGASASAELVSPALQALMSERKSLGPEEYWKRARALAEGGDTSAAELLGESYLAGLDGLAQDHDAACGWFERAAVARGDASHNLARCYELGQGRAVDLPRARQLYGRAAELDWVQAKCALGIMLVSGRGGAADAARGLALCREAAEAGNANAQADYGFYLLMGEVVPKDAPGALRWLTAAAEQRQANAALVLGQMHWNGDGTPADRAEAARWWRIAYENGRKDAAALISNEIFQRMVVDGKIVDRSLLPEWYHWLKIAAAEEPDPEKRKQFEKALLSLEKPE